MSGCCKGTKHRWWCRRRHATMAGVRPPAGRARRRSQIATGRQVCPPTRGGPMPLTEEQQQRLQQIRERADQIERDAALSMIRNVLAAGLSVPVSGAVFGVGGPA